MSETKSIKWIIIAVIILAILLVGFIFFMYEKNKKEALVYKGVNGEEYFFQEQVLGGNTTFYYIYIYVGKNEYIYPFRYYPKELEDLDIDINLKNDILSKNWIYVTQNLDTANKTQQQSFLGIMEVVRILGMANDGIYKKSVKNAFIEAYKNEAVASCSDVSAINGVIYFKLGEKNKVYNDNGCVIIEGKDADGLMKSSEAFAYHLLGVL